MEKTAPNQSNGKVILLPQDIAEKGRRFLLELGYQLKVSEKRDEATLCRDVVGCDAILLRNAIINRKILEAGTSLKVIGRHGVGVDNVDVEVATKLGIQVTYAPEANANTVADHVIGV
ncbi:3-phosphoglycerate dehydrogenase, partial [bacterium]